MSIEPVPTQLFKKGEYQPRLNPFEKTVLFFCVDHLRVYEIGASLRGVYDANVPKKGNPLEQANARAKCRTALVKLEQLGFLKLEGNDDSPIEITKLGQSARTAMH